MKEKLGFIVLLLANADLASSRETEVVCPSKPVEAAVGGDVTLWCHLDPPLDATNKTVEWRHGRLNHTVHLHRDGNNNHTEQRDDFEGRTSLFHEGLTRGNLSLELSAVRLSDTGTYRCSIRSETLNNSCYVTLTVVSEDEGNKTDDSSRKIGIYIIIGVIIVIVIIIVIAILCEAIALAECLGLCEELCAGIGELLE